MSDSIRIAEQMRESANQLRNLRVSRILAQQAKEDREYDVHVAEAYKLLDGATDDGIRIRDTKPEAVRDALLQAQLNTSKPYQSARSELHAMQRALAVIDADIERAINQLSALRAEARLLAAERAAVGE